jgi:hypothetical protein
VAPAEVFAGVLLAVREPVVMVALDAAEAADEADAEDAAAVTLDEPEAEEAVAAEPPERAMAPE